MGLKFNFQMMVKITNKLLCSCLPQAIQSFANMVMCDRLFSQDGVWYIKPFYRCTLPAKDQVPLFSKKDMQKQLDLPSLKWRFHETTKVNKIDHRCIQIDRSVLETSRPRRMDIGAVLAAD